MTEAAFGVAEGASVAGKACAVTALAVDGLIDGTTSVGVGWLTIGGESGPEP